MDRPVMDPTYAKDLIALPRQSLWMRAWQASRPVLRVLRIALRVLVWNPLTRKQDGVFRNEDGTFYQRLGRAIFYRLAFLPVMVAIIVAMFVWGGTHPQNAVAALDPNTKGVYYELIRFPIASEPRGEAWLIPQVDAQKVIEDGEKSLRRKYPAVVLVPECGRGADQVLPYIKPLHDAGFVVMALHLPNVSVVGSRGITFGLRESADVQAAVLVLRGKAFVDPTRIALVGMGGGANAILLAAERDPSLRTLILDRPFESSTAVINHIGPNIAGLRWLQPLCKWAFELSYQVDAEELNLNNTTKLLLRRNVLKFSVDDALDSFDTTQKTVEFLKQQLVK